MTTHEFELKLTKFDCNIGSFDLEMHFAGEIWTLKNEEKLVGKSLRCRRKT